MSEERFWNPDEYVSTAKFAVPDGAMTMRQAGRRDPREFCVIDKV